MDHKEAANTLIKLINKKIFKGKEEKAILIAIGVLSWTSLSQSRLKNKKTNIIK